MADWVADFFNPEVLKHIKDLEEEVRNKPGFDQFRRSFEAQLKKDSSRLAGYTAEQLIAQTETFEELMVLREYLQSRFGGDNVFWQAYHTRRIELAMLPSDYTEKSGRSRFALPVSAKEFKRSTVAGVRGVGVRRNLAGQLFSRRQLAGIDPVDISTKGVRFDKFMRGHTRARNYLAFDIETTGLLKQLAYKDTGAARGVASIGFAGRGAVNVESLMLGEIPTDRPYFGEYIEEVILPRHRQMESGGQEFIDRMMKEKRFGRGLMFRKAMAEKALVHEFVSTLEGAKGAALMGYNIEQFDIPFMKAMAQRHGMAGRINKALVGREIIDVSSMAKAFLSEQLGGQFVGWQEGMFKDLRINPAGWKQQALAHAFGFKGALSEAAHTPLVDTKMTEHLYEVFTKDPTGEYARKLWKQGGKARYMEALTALGQELVPMSELYAMTEVRGGKRYFNLPSYMIPGDPAAARQFADRLTVYGTKADTKAGSILQKSTTRLPEILEKAPTRPWWPKFEKAIPKLKWGGKFLGKSLLLGSVLPGEGPSNILGGLAAMGSWEAARRLGRGRSLAALAAAGTYATVKGAAALLQGSDDEVRERAIRNYEGQTARKESAALLDYYLPNTARTAQPQEGPSPAAEGMKILNVAGQLREAAKDAKYTGSELEQLAAYTSFAANKGALMQVLERDDARRAFVEHVRWRDRERSKQIKTLLVEGEGVGAFGWYRPGSKTLGVAALHDPRDIGALIGRIHDTEDAVTEAKTVEFAARVTNPFQYDETTLHEGLHAVWDVDMDPAHKRAFVGEAQRQLFADGKFGPDVQTLINKSSSYTKMVLFAHHPDPKTRELATDMVANEMFAHRGALLAYKDLGYELKANSALDPIVAQYVNWNKPKIDISPVYTGPDPDEIIIRGGIGPEAARRYEQTRRPMMHPGKGLQFSGFDDDYNTIEALGHQGIASEARRSLTQFGSGFDRNTHPLLSHPEVQRRPGLASQELYPSHLQTVVRPKLKVPYGGMAIPGEGWSSKTLLPNLTMPAVSPTPEPLSIEGLKQSETIRLRKANWIHPEKPIPSSLDVRLASAEKFSIKSPQAFWQIAQERQAALAVTQKPRLSYPKVAARALGSFGRFLGSRGRGLGQAVKKLVTDFGSPVKPLYDRPSLARAEAQASGLTVYGQPIAPEVQAFREKWFSTPEARRELERRKAELPQVEGEFEEDEMQMVGDGKAVINLSQFDWEFDDADTLVLERTGLWNFFFGDQIQIRLSGIDSPEIHHPSDPTAWFRYHQEQPYGEEAKEEAIARWGEREDLQALVFTDPQKRTYGRYIGMLSAPGEAEPINVQMVREGIAGALPWGESGSDLYPRKSFMMAEKEAQAQRQGMWNTEFFQRYQDISTGAGRRITFNTFTDLTRLARNYKLAAAESLMSREDIDYEPWMGKYIGSRLRKSYKPRQRLSQQWSGQDDAFNTIEGIGGGGMGGAMVKSHSEFGSGWDPFKNLATALAKKLFSRPRKQFGGQLMGSPAFTKALERGTAVRELGKGGFGRATLYETTIAGEKFQYVEKTIRKEWAEKSSHLKEIMETSLGVEYKALKKLKGDITPTAYHYDAGAGRLFMEYMPGKSLAEMHTAGELSKEAVRDIARSMDKQMKQVASKGMYNKDIALRNLMYDPKTKRVSWIDFGIAEPGAKKQSLTKMRAKFRAEIELSAVDEYAKTDPGMNTLANVSFLNCSIPHKAAYRAGKRHSVSSAKKPAEAPKPNKMGWAF